MKVRDAKVFVEPVGSDNPYTSLQVLADLGHMHIVESTPVLSNSYPCAVCWQKLCITLQLWAFKGEEEGRCCCFWTQG